MKDIEQVHKTIQSSKNTDLLTTTLPEFDNGSILHYLVQLKKPEAVAYLISRGQDVTIGDIACKDLKAINLNMRNQNGQTALEAAKHLLSQNENEEEAIKMRLIINFIELAQSNDPQYFDVIAAKIDHLEATYQAERNVIRTKAQATDLAKIPTASRVTFSKNLEDIIEHSMPHHPSFDQQSEQQVLALAEDPAIQKIFIDSQIIGKRKFLKAYKEDNFPQMEKAIIEHQLKFTRSDTISELAYEAINKNCLKMTKFLVRQGSASSNYIPNGETMLLKEKYDQAATLHNARAQAQREAMNLPTLKRSRSDALETPITSSTSPKKQRGII